MEDRTWLDFSLGIGIDSFCVWGTENDLVLVSGSKVILCDDVRPQVDMES